MARRLAQPCGLRRTSVGGVSINGEKIGSALRASPDFRWGDPNQNLSFASLIRAFIFYTPLSELKSLKNKSPPGFTGKALIGRGEKIGSALRASPDFRWGDPNQNLSFASLIRAFIFYTPLSELKSLKNKSPPGFTGKALIGRGEKTRTSDPLHPMQVR